jgi:hypothetical protein
MTTDFNKGSSASKHYEVFLLFRLRSLCTPLSESVLHLRSILILLLSTSDPSWTLLSLSLMLRPTVSRSVCLEIKHPSGAYDQILLLPEQLRVWWCGALSLTRGRVCRLQFLLALASAVILGPSPMGLATIFFCLRFETSFSLPPTLQADSSYIAAARTTQKRVLLLRGADHTENNSRDSYLAIPLARWLLPRDEL